MYPAETENNSIQERYRDNFARHIMGVGLYLQSEIMTRLTDDYGHRELRLHYEPYITIIGHQGSRLSNIAALLGISRQAANQTVNQIESAGYLMRRPDPSDRRAKRLVATGRGRQLIKDGTAVATALQEELEQITGDSSIREAMDVLWDLSGKLGLLLPSAELAELAPRPLLAALLPRLREYISDRLMQLSITKGHPDLKHSFGQVLIAIGPHGGRIQQMADMQGVSKQAISTVANELEDLGYIYRVVDANDARGLVLHFTERGRGLIEDSVTSVDELYREFEDLIGPRAMKKLTTSMSTLYRALHLEEEIFGNSAAIDIRALADQLTRQLGNDGARALGQMLISPAEI